MTEKISMTVAATPFCELAMPVDVSSRDEALVLAGWLAGSRGLESALILEGTGEGGGATWVTTHRDRVKDLPVVVVGRHSEGGTH